MKTLTLTLFDALQMVNRDDTIDRLQEQMREVRIKAEEKEKHVHKLKYELDNAKVQ